MEYTFCGLKVHASGNAFCPIFNGAFNVKLEGEYDALLQFVGVFHSKPNAIKLPFGDIFFPSIYIYGDSRRRFTFPQIGGFIWRIPRVQGYHVGSIRPPNDGTFSGWCFGTWLDYDFPIILGSS